MQALMTVIRTVAWQQQQVRCKHCGLYQFPQGFCVDVALLLLLLQYDEHLPVLTVAETLEFAHACAGKRPDFISKDQLKEA